jgi:DNA repair exonuclease SbcCD nuclease subunit
MERSLSQLFKKLAFFTDIHFGRSSNNPVLLEDTLGFVRWFVQEAKSRGCETMIFGGDWHDNRHSIAISTLHASLEGLQLLNDSFEKVWFIPGNHDLYYRDRRDIASIEFARYLPNIDIIRDPTTIDGVTFLPWLVGEETKRLKIPKSRYTFAHLEMPGFLMNARVEMPDSPHAVHDTAFSDQDYVFTGHFHMRQIKKNVVYTGNVMPFNFSDNWDEDRGAMFLEWGGTPEFVAWPEQPLFRTLKLSELLENPESVCCPKLTVRVTIDIDISYEEARLIKETYTEQFGLRKVELVHQASQESDQQFSTDVVFQSVDQIVVDGLMSVESTDLKPHVLVDIYKGLAA